MSGHRLERVQIFPRPLDEVFPFFADARNLERITPGFLRFRIVSGLPLEIVPGTLIDYRLRLFGIPFDWRTRIETFEPGVGFTDVQVRGPYRRWHHEHRFWAVDGGTLMRDRVDYALPLGWVGRPAHALFVRASLERIFDHRRRVMADLLGGEGEPGRNSATLAS